MTISTKIQAPTGHSIHHMPCPHDCPDTCSTLVTRNDTTGKAVAIQGDPTHPVTRGFLCNKVNHYVELVYSEKRVLYPPKRVGTKGPGAIFERITWDEALDTITITRLHKIANTLSRLGNSMALSTHSPQCTACLDLRCNVLRKRKAGILLHPPVARSEVATILGRDQTHFNIGE